MIALEEEIGSAPNSMMDFEAWKAKMKEMERKKKGLGGSVDSINLLFTNNSFLDFLSFEVATSPMAFVIFFVYIYK